MSDETISELLKEAARKLELGEPLQNSLEGPVVIAVLRGLAEGKTLKGILKKKAPRRPYHEIYYLVDEACTRLGTKDAAYRELAERELLAETKNRPALKEIEKRKDSLEKEYRLALALGAEMTPGSSFTIPMAPRRKGKSHPV